MEMATYIISILRMNLNTVLSWGIHNIVACENGIEFLVQGFNFKGWVTITYNEGTDLFDLNFQNKKSVEKIEGVYVDGLVDVIDRHVEYTGANYKNDVDTWLRSL